MASKFLLLLSSLLAADAVFGQTSPPPTKLAELHEKIETLELKLSEQSKLVDSLTRLEGRLNKLQQLQVDSVGTIESRLEEAEEKLLGFSKLPDLVSQLEERVETVIQLEVDNILPIQEKLEEAHQKLSVCSNIREVIGGIDSCISSITQVNNIQQRLVDLEQRVKSVASSDATRKKFEAQLADKLELVVDEAKKAASLETRVHQLEGQLMHQSNLSDLYNARQASVNKLQGTDIADVQVRLRRAEQKLLELSSQSKLARQASSVTEAPPDRSSFVFPQAERSLLDDRFKAQNMEISAVKHDLESLKKTQRSSDDSIRRLEAGIRDLAQVGSRATSELANLTAACQTFPDMVDTLEQQLNLTSMDLDVRVRNNTESLRQLRKGMVDYDLRLGAISTNLSAVSSRHLHLEKNLTVELDELHKRVDVAGAQMRSDVLSLRKADEGHAAFKKSLERARLVDRIADLEERDAATMKETRALNEATETLKTETLLNAANITIIRFNMDLNQDIIQKNMSTLMQGAQIFLTNFREHMSQLQSHKSDILKNADKLKSLEDVVSRHDAKINDATSKQNDDVAARMAAIERESVTAKRERAILMDNFKQVEGGLQMNEGRMRSHQGDIRSNAVRLKLLEDTVSGVGAKQGNNMPERLATVERDSLTAKKERAILYDNIQQVEETLQQNEPQTKAYVGTIASMTAQMFNISATVSELRDRMSFFHPNSAVNAVVDRSKERTELHVAAMDGDAKRVGYLLKNGADVEIRDYKKWKPLHLAAWQGHDAVVQVLLDGGAQVDALDSFRYTPLHWAAQYGREGCAELLIDAGANLEAKDDNDETPLHKAAWYEQNNMVAMLVRKGAKVNAYRKEHYTALHLSAQKGYLECVRILVRGGADVAVMNDDGYTPLQLAVAYKHKDIIDYLEDQE